MIKGEVELKRFIRKTKPKNKFLLYFFLMLFCSNITPIHSKIKQVASQYIFTNKKNISVIEGKGWIISEPVIIENQTIYLNENLTIESTGSLILRNVSLFIGKPSEGIIRILAKPNSSLIISKSIISPIQEGITFIFVVQGAHFELAGSQIQGIGRSPEYAWSGGLIIYDSNEPIIEDNIIIHQVTYGITLTRCTGSIIRNNVITYTGPDEYAGAIYLNYSHNNSITYNRLYRQWDAVHLHCSWNNYIANNKLTLTTHTIGISLWYESGNNTIAYNEITPHEGYNYVCTPFRVIGCHKPNLIFNNTFKNTWEAGLVDYSSEIIIANNHCFGLYNKKIGAFHIYRSNNIKLLNNEIESSLAGFLLLGASNNEIKGNKISNAYYGICLFLSSNHNIIEENAFSSNVDNIIIINSEFNKIQKNNFLAGTRQAYDNRDNYWHNNFWSDYSGQDIDGDGYGESPYFIPSSGKDLAPKINPYKFDYIPVSPLVPAENETFLWEYNELKEDKVFENEEIDFLGSLLITNNAKLTFKKCKIRGTHVNHHIWVREGSGLYLYDTELLGDGEKSYFSLRVDKGADLVICNSKIYFLGDWAGNGGIQIRADNAIIEDSEIVGAYTGIEIRHSSRHRLRNNVIKNCVDGILIVEGKSSENVIEGNIISDCVESGLGLIGVEKSTISNNTVKNCSLGIMIGGTNNVISNNNFINNGDEGKYSLNAGWNPGQGFDYGMNNFWDNNGRGNYWSDYRGQDKNSDGIGDVPYYIPPNGIDYFPLSVVKYNLKIICGRGGTTEPPPGSYDFEPGTEVLITAIPDKNYKFIGWSGSIMSNSSTLLIYMNASKQIKADFIRIIYPPLNFSGKKILNKSLFLNEYINELTWESNPNNEKIVGYKLYLLENGKKTLLTFLDASIHSYWHRKVDKEKTYTYYLVAVNEEFREGEPAIISVQ